MIEALCCVPIIQRIGDPRYVEIVFGIQDIPSVFIKYRKSFKKPGMTKKQDSETDRYRNRYDAQ